MQLLARVDYEFTQAVDGGLLVVPELESGLKGAGSQYSQVSRLCD